MSEILAEVVDIKSIDTLNIVTFSSLHNSLKMMSLDLSEQIQISTKVKLSVKPTSIAIAKELSGELSYSNQLNATIKVIEFGELLSCVTLDIKDTQLESIITTSSAKRMALKINDSVTALIKSSDLSILEVV